MVKPQNQVLQISFHTNFNCIILYCRLFPTLYQFWHFSSIGNDLATLSLSDHSILSYGTFGIWGALLRKKDGEVVLPKLQNNSFSPDIIKREWQEQGLKENASMDSYGYEIPDCWMKL